MFSLVCQKMKRMNVVKLRAQCGDYSNWILCLRSVTCRVQSPKSHARSYTQCKQHSTVYRAQRSLAAHHIQYVNPSLASHTLIHMIKPALNMSNSGTPSAYPRRATNSCCTNINMLEVFCNCSFSEKILRKYHQVACYIRCALRAWMPLDIVMQCHFANHASVF